MSRTPEALTLNYPLPPKKPLATEALPAGERICARGGSQVARINFCKTRAGDQADDGDDDDDDDAKWN